MTRFKVVKLPDLMEMPKGWQWPGDWTDEFREKFETALNRMAKEGWLYVDSFATGSVLLIIFSSEPQPSSASPHWITDLP